MTTSYERDDISGGYVECTECGHPIELHDTTGCQTGTGDGTCTCRVSWTKKAIRAYRQSQGLRASYDPANLTD